MDARISPQTVQPLLNAKGIYLIHPVIQDRIAEPTEPVRDWAISVMNGANKDVPDGLEIKQFVNWASTQGVLALLFQTLSDLAPESSLTRQLGDSNKQYIAQVILLQEERQNVLGLLEPLQPLILKGEALAHFCYEHYHLRPMVDLDLLIEPSRYSDIENTLTTAGYFRSNSVGGSMVMPQTSFVKKLAGDIKSVIDIHTALFNRPALRSLLSYRDLLDMAVHNAHSAGMVPCPGHLLVHASLHLLAHHANNQRVIWLYDIKLLLDQLDSTDSQVVTRFCQHHNLSAALLDAIEASLDVFPTETPAPLVESLREQARKETASNFAAGLKNTQTRSRRVIEDWNSLKEGNQRGAWLRQHLLPPSEYMMQKYHVASKWLLPFFYLWRILRGSVKLFASK